MAEREEGWYWVRFDPDIPGFTAAEYEYFPRPHWRSDGHFYKDDDFCEIGPRILPPESARCFACRTQSVGKCAECGKAYCGGCMPLHDAWHKENALPPDGEKEQTIAMAAVNYPVALASGHFISQHAYEKPMSSFDHNELIEKCAKVVDEYGMYPTQTKPMLKGQIAEVIRALKSTDQPKDSEPRGATMKVSILLRSGERHNYGNVMEISTDAETLFVKVGYCIDAHKYVKEYGSGDWIDIHIEAKEPSILPIAGVDDYKTPSKPYDGSIG